MEAMPISKAIIAARDAVLGTSNKKDSKGSGSPESLKHSLGLRALLGSSHPPRTL